MNSKQIGIVVVVALVLLVAGVLGLWVFAGNKPVESEITPTPSQAYQEVDPSVEVTLVPNAKKTAVALKITGLDGKYSGIEYELNYETDKGPRGTLSGSTPIPINGKDEFTDEVELGTCSSGGKCSFDAGVHNFHFSAKLHTPSGEIHILRKDFESI